MFRLGWTTILVGGVLLAPAHPDDAPHTGRVVGSVRLRVSEDPIKVLRREDATAREVAIAERLIDPVVGFDRETRGLRGVVVYLPKRPAGMATIPPRPPRVIQVTDLGLAPRLDVITVGQPVVLSNLLRQPMLLSWSPVANRTATVGVPGRSILEAVTFQRVEPGPIAVLDDSGVTGHWLVLDHGLFAITDSRGRFEIDGLPPGRHEFRVLHPYAELRTVPLVVHVAAGRTTTVEMNPSPLVLRKHDPGTRPTGWLDMQFANLSAALDPDDPIRRDWLTSSGPGNPFSNFEDRTLAGLRRALAGRNVSRRQFAARLLLSDFEFAKHPETLVPLAVDEDPTIREYAISELGYERTLDADRTIALAEALNSDDPDSRLRDLLARPGSTLFDHLLPVALARHPDATLEMIGEHRPYNVVAAELAERLPGNPYAATIQWNAYRHAATGTRSRVAELSRFGSTYVDRFGTRVEARARLPDRLRSSDPQVFRDALTKLDELGPAAVVEVRRTLVDIAWQRRHPRARRIAAIERLATIAHEPEATQLLWSVGRDGTRTVEERVPALTAIVEALDRGHLTPEWRQRTTAARTGLVDSRNTLRITFDLQRLIDEQRTLRKRTENAQVSGLLEGLVELGGPPAPGSVTRPAR